MVSILSSSSYILPLCHTKIQNRLSRQLFSQKATKIISKAEDLHLAINTTTSKYCSVAFIRIITLWDSIRLKKWNHLLKHTKRHQRRLQPSSLPFNRKSAKRTKLVLMWCSHEKSQSSTKVHCKQKLFYYHFISRLRLFIEALSLIGDSSGCFWISTPLLPQASPHVFFIQQWIHLGKRIHGLLMDENVID